MLAHLPNVPWVEWLLGLLTVLGLVTIWRMGTPNKSYGKGPAGFILLWAILPILIFTPAWTKEAPTYYFVPSIPAFCVLASVTVVWLSGLGTHKLLAIVFMALIVSA